MSGCSWCRLFYHMAEVQLPHHLLWAASGPGGPRGRRDGGSNLVLLYYLLASPKTLCSRTASHTGTVDINPSACLETACLQVQATIRCATPFGVYFTLNLQARDPPIGLHKAELWVQVFLKIDATPDSKKLKGHYGNTQPYCFVTV